MISLLLINYRSSALALEAIRSARAASSTPLQIVVVDNSVDEAEAAAFRDVDSLYIADRNLGYAAGINRGRAIADGDVLLVTNPDVVFGPGAIDRLAEQLDGRTAVAGPALFWDDAHEWMLPPSDLHTGWQKIDEVLAARSQAWLETRDRRRFLQRVAFWSLREPRDVEAISGAVMAIRTHEFDAAGGFDERFPLYFEETDFLRRLTALRKSIRYVPAAKVRHLYNQSAGQVAGDASSSYATSERRYLEKWNGPFGARVLSRVAREPRGFEARPLDGPIELDRDDVVIEVSPLATFATAAGHFPKSRRVELPEEVLSAWRGSVLYLRVVVRATGEVLATYARSRS